MTSIAPNMAANNTHHSTYYKLTSPPSPKAGYSDELSNSVLLLFTSLSSQAKRRRQLRFFSFRKLRISTRDGHLHVDAGGGPATAGASVEHNPESGVSAAGLDPGLGGRAFAAPVAWTLRQCGHRTGNVLRL
uniref:(northern house mosquito) hypothetical protein n=1 Tax=Culex pipiens TaxID=7175 RepID=A0A8D8ARR7_CULPI